MKWLLVLLVACTTAKPAAERMGDVMFGKSDNYERFMGRWSRLLAPQLIAFAGVQDGDNILDVGSGTGVLAFAIRDATTKGEIVGIDPSDDYVHFASKHEHEARITFSVGDAQALTFADNRFDKTLSLLVVNFIPDRDKAVKEMIRVTKSGGVVAAAVWDYGDGMEMFACSGARRSRSTARHPTRSSCRSRRTVSSPRSGRSTASRTSSRRR